LRNAKREKERKKERKEKKEKGKARDRFCSSIYFVGKEN